MAMARKTESPSESTELAQSQALITGHMLPNPLPAKTMNSLNISIGWTYPYAIWVTLSAPFVDHTYRNYLDMVVMYFSLFLFYSCISVAIINLIYRPH